MAVSDRVRRIDVLFDRFPALKEWLTSQLHELFKNKTCPIDVEIGTRNLNVPRRVTELLTDRNTVKDFQKDPHGWIKRFAESKDGKERLAEVETENIRFVPGLMVEFDGREINDAVCIISAVYDAEAERVEKIFDPKFVPFPEDSQVGWETLCKWWSEVEFLKEDNFDAALKRIEAQATNNQVEELRDGLHGVHISLNMIDRAVERFDRSAGGDWKRKLAKKGKHSKAAIVDATFEVDPHDEENLLREIKSFWEAHDSIRSNYETLPDLVKDWLESQEGENGWWDPINKMLIRLSSRYQFTRHKMSSGEITYEDNIRHLLPFAECPEHSTYRLILERFKEQLHHWPTSTAARKWNKKPLGSTEQLSNSDRKPESDSEPIQKNNREIPPKSKNARAGRSKVTGAQLETYQKIYDAWQSYKASAEKKLGISLKESFCADLGYRLDDVIKALNYFSKIKSDRKAKASENL